MYYSRTGGRETTGRLTCKQLPSVLAKATCFIKHLSSKDLGDRFLKTYDTMERGQSQ